MAHQLESAAPRAGDDIDQRFEAILSDPLASTTELTTEELAEAQRLFLEISANYLGPVRDLMVEIDLGEPTKEWFAVCRPAVTALRRAAADMLLPELAAGLSGLLEVIENAERSLGNLIDLRARDALRTAYQRLSSVLPLAFEIREERDRREPIIVQTLLRQVPDVRKVALDRIYAAGLTNLEMFYKAKPGDISEAAGISRELAERIVARFQRYRRELSSAPPAPSRTRERAQLEQLTRKLEEQNHAFEASAKVWQTAEEKRRIRQERSSTVLEINLLLARMGELNLLQQLERLPFQIKTQELRRFLSARAG